LSESDIEEIPQAHVLQAEFLEAEVHNPDQAGKDETSAENVPSIATPQLTPSTPPSSAKKRPLSEPRSLSSSSEPARKKVASSVRNALEFAQETGEPKSGILRWFKPGTKADIKAYWDRHEEEAAERQSHHEFIAKNEALEKKMHERELVRLRVQKHRVMKKEKEINSGRRSPGGTKLKRKVCSGL
jgi:hypothetical protein